jgi:hypothetical protein
MADNDMLYLPTVPDAPYPLGRSIVWHDPRNREHRALVPQVRTALPPRQWPWSRTTAPFDQVDQNCTAEAAVGLMRTQPHTSVFGRHHYRGYDEEPERVAFYKESQQYDPWDGTNYDGTSTDAPFKLLRARGVTRAWSWLFGADELAEWLKHYGAAVVGTVWYRSMFDVNSDGFVVVDPASGVAGGHAYEVIFCHPAQGHFEIVNSWGAAWGKRGRARIAAGDMRHLLDEQGEAVTVAPGSVV